MKALILAAGYATRLYPLTIDTPKHLLPVAGRPIVEHMLEKLLEIDEIDGLYLVTNSKFAWRFRHWEAGYPREVVVIDDGTVDDATKRGAIGDIDFVLEREGIADDLVVVAGDNLFSESLEGFGECGRERGAPVLAVYDVGDLKLVREYNSIEIDADGRITFFEEKPADPRSTLAGIALYFYPRETLPLIRRYVAEGNNPDQPGRLIQWLYPRLDVYTWPVPGLWFDIGSREQLEEADRLFSEAARPSSDAPSSR